MKLQLLWAVIALESDLSHGFNAPSSPSRVKFAKSPGFHSNRGITRLESTSRPMTALKGVSSGLKSRFQAARSANLTSLRSAAKKTKSVVEYVYSRGGLKGRLALAAIVVLSAKMAAEFGMQLSLGAHVLYSLETWLNTAAFSKVLGIASGLGLLIFMCASWYKLSTKPSVSWPQSLFKAAQLLINAPGGSAVDVDGEEGGKPPSRYTRWVTHLIYVQGLVFFSFFIGLISTDVSGAFERVATGQHVVLERGHTVLVNWNDNTVPVLRQLAAAHRQGGSVGLPVVILGNREKAEMDAELASSLSARDRRELRVITRSGNPTVPDALARVAAPRAKRVIVLKPPASNTQAAVGAAALPSDSSVKDDAISSSKLGSSSGSGSTTSSSTSSSSSSRISEGVAADWSPIEMQAVALAAARDLQTSTSGKSNGGGGGGNSPTVVVSVPMLEAELGQRVGLSGMASGDTFWRGPAALFGKDAASGTVAVAEQAFASRLIAVAVLHPGLVSAHAEIMGFEGAEFCTLDAKTLPSSLARRLASTATGTTTSATTTTNNGSSKSTSKPLSAGELSRRLNGQAVLCGVLRAETTSSSSSSSSSSSMSAPSSLKAVKQQEKWLMPSDDLILKKSDRLILLGQSKVEASAFNGNGKTKGRTGQEGGATTVAVPADESTHASAAAGASRPFALSSSNSGGVDTDGAISREMRKVLVVNWTPRVSGMVEHLDNLAAHHSGHVEVTVLMPPGPQAQTARESLAEELARSPGERVTVNVVEGSSLDQVDLMRAGANEADTLVVLRQQSSSFSESLDTSSSQEGEDLEPEAPDARTLVTVAALSDLARTAAEAAVAPSTATISATSTNMPVPPPKATPVVTFGTPYPTNPKLTSASTSDVTSSITGRHLVVEFASPDAMAHTRTVLEQQKEHGQELWSSVDTFVPSDLASGALVQVAMDPKLASVFAELQGAAVDLELIPGTVEEALSAHTSSAISRATTTSTPQQPTFAELQDVVRAQEPGCVLVGLRRPTNTPGERTLLCPKSNLVAMPSDRLLVLRFPEASEVQTPLK